MRDFIMQMYNILQAFLKPVAYAIAAAVTDEEGRVMVVRHSYKIGLQIPLGGVNRNEPASVAVMRELHEEVGLQGGVATLFGVYSRRTKGWATNVLVLYRITGATVAFKQNLEVRSIQFVDPRNPPPECTPDTRRRLLELAGLAPIDPYW